MKRRYTVTNKDYAHGTKFKYNGKLYRRSIIGDAIFDHDISPERTDRMVAEFKSDAKLSIKAYNKKYGVQQNF